MKLKPAQENWYRVAICLHEFGQHLVAPRLQILEIFRVIGAEPHHHGKVADLGGVAVEHLVNKFLNDGGSPKGRGSQKNFSAFPSPFRRLAYIRFGVTKHLGVGTNDPL